MISPVPPYPTEKEYPLLHIVPAQRDWWAARARDAIELLTNIHIHGTADWNDRVAELRLAVTK